MTVSAHAAVPTAAAERYLAQLCKHFAHKIPVTYSSGAGIAEFPGGACRLNAADGVLSLRCEADDAGALERIKAIVDDHLKRFAWRESVIITWKAQS